MALPKNVPVHQIWIVSSPFTDTVDGANTRTRDFEKLSPFMEKGVVFT